MAKQVLYCLFLGAALGAEFSYDRCAADGPKDWSGQCKGQATNSEGTPINLCGAQTIPSGAPAMVVSGYSTARQMTIFNNGHTVQINVVSDAPTLEMGNLSAIVGRSTNQTTQTWVLQQIHLHWGRTDKNNEGSEHYLQGTAYPLEAHYVHFNSRWGTFSNAIAQGGSEALLVVGVFLQLGQTDVNLMTAIAANITTLTQTPKSMGQSVTLTDLFDGTGAYYTYRGSLTTPGCNEIVTWVVMSSPKTMTLDTLNKIKKASASPPATVSHKFAPLASGLISDFGNFRPLQPLGNRTVWYSTGTTAACTTPTEPTFTCTSAGFMATPSLIAQLVFLSAFFVSRM